MLKRIKKDLKQRKPQLSHPNGKKEVQTIRKKSQEPHSVVHESDEEGKNIALKNVKVEYSFAGSEFASEDLENDVGVPQRTKLLKLSPIHKLLK